MPGAPGRPRRRQARRRRQAAPPRQAREDELQRAEVTIDAEWQPHGPLLQGPSALAARALVLGHSRNGQPITQVLSRFAPQAKLARNHGPNVMDGGRLYHVTFLRLAGLNVAGAYRASIGKTKQRIEEAARPDAWPRASEVLADLDRAAACARPLSRGDADRQSRRHLAARARRARPRRSDRRRGHAPLEEAAHRISASRGELTPYHEHNAERERPRLIARLRAGQSVALISDAGTPLISDPGYKLVREALDAGHHGDQHPRPFGGARRPDQRRACRPTPSCSRASCRRNRARAGRGSKS